MNPITTTTAGGTVFDVAGVFAQIREHNRIANEGVHHMIEAGKLLSMLKTKLPHGQFIKMAISETKLSRTTISRYMQMAANAPRVKHLKSGRDAMDTITQLSREFNKTTPPPAARPSPAPVTIEAEIVEPSPAPAVEPAPKEEDQFISIRVSDLKEIIADIDKGFSLIRVQETFIEDAIEAGKIKLTGNGDDIVESYMLAVGKAQSQIGSAIDRIEWNVPQKLRGPSTINLESLIP